MKNQFHHLTFDERVKIEVFLDAGASQASVARCLGRHRCTISREVKRLTRSGPRPYVAPLALMDYQRKRRLAARGRRKLGTDLSTPLWSNIISQLRHGWSPEQYAGRTRLLEGLHLPSHLLSPLYASHETIYRAIRDLPHSPARADLTRLLRRSTRGRRPRRSSSRYTGLQNMTHLSQRPAEVMSRLTLGHWEGDLIKGARNGSAVGTLVERASRLTLLVHLPSANSSDVYEGFYRVLSALPPGALKSLTYDRGSEMARHEELSQALNIPIFFCPAYSPGDRATNENTNGLLRQYLPKGTDLSVHSPADLATVQTNLNTRPRQVLKYRTPTEAFNAMLLAMMSMPA